MEHNLLVYQPLSSFYVNFKDKELLAMVNLKHGERNMGGEVLL